MTLVKINDSEGFIVSLKLSVAVFWRVSFCGRKIARKLETRVDL